MEKIENVSILGQDGGLGAQGLEALVVRDAARLVRPLRPPTRSRSEPEKRWQQNYFIAIALSEKAVLMTFLYAGTSFKLPR